MSPFNSKTVLRSGCLVFLVAFSTATLFAFSLFLDLRATRAQLGLPTPVTIMPPGDVTTQGVMSAIASAELAAKTAQTVAITAGQAAQSVASKLWDFAKGIATAFVIAFVVQMALKLMRKLESYHIIKDIMAYSDALEFDQYLGRQLNKWTLKPKQKSDLKTTPDETNVGSITTKAVQNPINTMSREQVEQLANSSSQANGPSRLDDLQFFTNEKKTQVTINKGEGVPLYAIIKGQNLLPVYNGRNVAADGFEQYLESVKPEQTTTYTMYVYDNQGALLRSKDVKVTVRGTQEKPRDPNAPPPQKSSNGLTAAQENNLIRGGVAMLTSAVACGGVNTQAVRNVAIYSAARNRGFNPASIDPSSGNFYTYMYRLGNPFASPDFQELMMRDTAATLEAQARVNVQTELTSNGLKSLRAESSGISRTSQTIVDYISQTTGTALQGALQGASSSFAARTIGSILANLVIQALLKQDGTVINEYPYCGVAQLAADETAKTAIGGIDVDSQSGTVQNISDLDPNRPGPNQGNPAGGNTTSGQSLEIYEPEFRIRE